MLNFDDELTTRLNKASTTAFWVLKLYYNDDTSASNFIGVSDVTRIDGSDEYYGIVSSWGKHIQSLDFFNFHTSTSNISLKLINTDRTINNGRFSDLFATKNFSNRKWELFLNTNEPDSVNNYDDAERMIGSGIIAGNISYDDRLVSITLFDNSSKYHNLIPKNTVAAGTYTNAPENNIGKPIPMAYGDFYEKTDIGTIPTTHFDSYYNFYKGAFPAIITDKFDVQEAAVEAAVDSQAIHTLDNENVYIYSNNTYATMTGTVNATGRNPVIEFSGAGASFYVPISTSNIASESGSGSYAVSDEERIGDGSFSNYASWAANSGTTNNSVATMTFAVPKVNSIGTYSAVSVLVKWGTNSDFEGDNGETFRYTANSVNEDHDTISDNSVTKTAVGSLYSGKTTTFDFEGPIQFSLRSGSDNTNHSAQIYEAGLVIDITSEEIEQYDVVEEYEHFYPTSGYVIQPHGPPIQTSVPAKSTMKVRTATYSTPAKIDYVYYSGKGRKYGSWIDANSRNQGYNENDLIENPVFMIEDILRSELSLTSSEIDYDSFDTSGNTSNGYIGEYFADAVGDIKFAFSQHKFIPSKDLIEHLGSLCFSYIFISGDSKIKIKTLRQKDDYSSQDQIIDFNDIVLGNISQTSIGSVKNSIEIKYNHDYAGKSNKSTATATDSTSQGTTVNGFNDTLKLMLDANEILDSTTATKLAEAYLYLMKDRKVVIDFKCSRPKYNHLEIGDIVKFSNWDSNIKIYGTAMGTDYYMVTKIEKHPNNTKMEIIKVS
jgi:hypothetical protein|tara:strand:- start:407 stop:2722 length:2316 start_codon:yes stop_codon:yes gene_type:complete